MVKYRSIFQNLSCNYRFMKFFYFTCIDKLYRSAKLIGMSMDLEHQILGLYIADKLHSMIQSNINLKIISAVISLLHY